jgi:hypothetical protein
MRARVTLAPLLALLVLAIPACGGGDDQLSEADYKAEVKKFCTEQDKESEALGEPKSTESKELAKFFQKGTDLQEKYKDQFADLQPPDKFEDLHNEVEDLNEQEVKLLQDVTDELEKGGDARQVIEKYQPQIDQLQKRGDELADQVGVAECKSSS